jgi:uracil-DNA glycosylase
MSDHNNITIDDIIRFLENEKEVYGPFSIAKQSKSGEKLTENKPAEGKQDATESNPEHLQPVSTSSTEIKQKQESLSLKERLETCTTLDDLRLLCETADELRTDLEGTNLVFGVGNPNADLMLIGEAPGEQEDIQGEPFVGAAGQLLNKILKAIEFDRQDIYIANILKHRPPGNRNPNPDERIRSLPYLLRQIDLIRPKLILCLGRISGTTLLKREDSLKNMRGQFYPFRNTELTVTYHPAALLRNPQWKRPAWEDVQQVRKRYDELGGKP